MRGVPFFDTPGSPARGLSWADFAVLFRSVSNDAGPLVDAMRSRSIPFVIKGLNKLFDSPEIQAVVGIFRFMVSELDAASLRQIWAVAELLPVDRVWDRGIEVLNEGRNFDRGSRWGVYNIQRVYLDFLEAIEMGQGAANCSFTNSANSAKQSPTSSKFISTQNRLRNIWHLLLGCDIRLRTTTRMRIQTRDTRSPTQCKS
jgi:superfamily I DNA/RNA helicase